jgi:hypothetical protein
MHMSESAEWLTPIDIIERSRSALGAIDTDPASTEFANEWIRARTIYTASTRGLAHEWHGNVFLNPPGDRKGTLPKLFFRKLVKHFLDGDVEKAIYMGFSLSQLQMVQADDEWHRLVNQQLVQICVCLRRPKYRNPQGEEMGSPTHGGFVAFLATPGPDKHTFGQAFNTLGQIFIPEAQ